MGTLLPFVGMGGGDLILLPRSFVFNRSTRLPPLTFSILCRFLLLGLVQCVINVCAYAGIEYNSPTLSTAMLNLVPAFTFLLAVIFRMEKLEYRSISSQAKTLGTLVLISAAFVVTFYKGPIVIKTKSLGVATHLLIFSPQLKWIIGALLLATEAFMLLAMYILQTMVLKMFPTVFIVIFYLNFFSTILFSFYSLILVEDPSAWKLRLDIGLVAVLYSAPFGTFLLFTFCAWCLSKAGPLFVSIFKPLAIIFTIIIGVLFLGDALCLGSLINAIIIVIGFYAIIWGKANEKEKSKEESGLQSFKSSSEKVPLLQNRIEDTRVSA
ncbi:hypothetical protein SLA2020_237970 [Shorea laevis]